MMICPACRRGLPAGPLDRCPFCAVVLAAPVEGALAPELRGKTEPLREMPGLRKRERTWKDEVRERVRERRTLRGAELPLFPDLPEGEPAEHGPSILEDEPEPAPAGAVASPLSLDEVPLHTAAAPSEAATDLRLASPGPRHVLRPELEAKAVDRALEWPVGLGGDAKAPVQPVERPATAAERLQAALVDLCLLVPLATLIVYGAARAAQTEVAALRTSWPWLLAFLVGFGLLYAGYFTGISGRTLGKMLLGLRVVGPGEKPPGWGRATLRALVGACGVLLAGGGLVGIFVDPARRTFHDRLLHTRVIKG